MAIDVKSLLVSLKSFSRANPFPLDVSSVWDSKDEADNYAKEANAYAGQVITALVDDKYKIFTLQESDGGLYLESVSDDFNTQSVIVGTRPIIDIKENVIYIEDSIGYVWDGSKWQKIFENVSSSLADLQNKISELENKIDEKAGQSDPDFTGQVTVNGKEIATKEYVDSALTITTF